MTEVVSALAKLREPFPPHQISKLPKESKAQADQRKQNRDAGMSCKVCGGWHHKSAVHLDYVGHAALTDRLLDVDPVWSWQPASVGVDGLPAFDRNGGLWIKLTIAGVTRLGYGSADGKSGGDAVKEIIGDALRNAAMRFGAALDLWHKGDLHVEEDDAGGATAKPVSNPKADAAVSRPPNREAIAWVEKLKGQLKECVTIGDVTAIAEKNAKGLDRLRSEEPELFAEWDHALGMANAVADDVPF